MGLLTTILEMPRAWFRGHAGEGGNELFLDAKPDTGDPVKVRQGTFDKGLHFGALSGDLLSGNPDEPRRAEKVLVGLLPDDDSAVRHWIDDEMPGGVFQVGTQKAGTDDDAGMIRTLRLSARYAELYGQRLATRHEDGRVEWHLGGGGSSAGPSNRFYHEPLPNGLVPFVTIHQRDGHVVLYQIVSDDGRTPIPEAEWGAHAVWSNLHGQLKPWPWVRWDAS